PRIPQRAGGAALPEAGLALGLEDAVRAGQDVTRVDGEVGADDGDGRAGEGPAVVEGEDAATDGGGGSAPGPGHEEHLARVDLTEVDVVAPRELEKRDAERDAAAIAR